MRLIITILFFIPIVVANAQQSKGLIIKGDTLMWLRGDEDTVRVTNLWPSDSALVKVPIGANTSMPSTSSYPTMTGVQNITNKTFLSGNTWNGNAISDLYIASSAIWNAKQDALGFTAVPNTRTINGQALSGNVTLSFTKSDVGLGNVDNTSDANKPVSTATQTALNAKQATLVSATNIKTINGTTLLGSGDLGVTGTNTTTYVNLASPFSSTSTTEAAVTGWSFAVTSGKAYRVEVIGLYQTAATTTGGELGFFLTASGAGTIAGSAEGAIVSTAAASSLSQQISAIGAADLAGSNLITTGVTAINSPHYIKSTVIFICTVSGTFNVGWASEVNSSASQLNTGSSLIYQVLN